MKKIIIIIIILLCSTIIMTASYNQDKLISLDDVYLESANFINLNVDKLKELINKDFPVNRRNRDGINPILMAVKNGYIDYVKILATAGADPYLTDQRGDSALSLAIKENWDCALEIIKAVGNQKDSTGYGVLSYGAMYGDVEVVKKILSMGYSKNEKNVQGKIAKLFTYQGLKRTEVEEDTAGDIIALSGIADIAIGDTICDLNHPEKIPFVDIDEPTVSMTFSVNNGPFAGKEGQFITSRHIRDRLFKELERNVSLRVKETDSADSFEVCGRGELHLSVLIETMRREGFELLVSRPKVIFKEIDGVKCEPMERLVVNVPDDSIGTVIEKLGRRKAEMVNMEPAEEGHTKIEFKIPARGLIGYRTEFLTDTKGTGTMNSIFDSYEAYKGEIQSRTRGVLVAFEQGTSVTYGLYNAQERGELLIGPGVDVYEGMIVGINSRNEDIAINVCKEKHLTNTRASGSDDALRLVPPIQMSLEKAIEFIAEDELVEVTPKNIRLRKKILDTKTREREARR